MLASISKWCIGQSICACVWCLCLATPFNGLQMMVDLQPRKNPAVLLRFPRPTRLPRKIFHHRSVPLFLEQVSSFTIEVEKHLRVFEVSMGFWVLLVGWLVLLEFWCMCWFDGELHKHRHRRAYTHTHTDCIKKLTRITDIKHSCGQLFCCCVGLLSE